MNEGLRKGLVAFYKYSRYSKSELESILETTMYLMEKMLKVGLASQTGYYKAKMDICCLKLYGKTTQSKGFKFYVFKEKLARSAK